MIDNEWRFLRIERELEKMPLLPSGGSRASTDTLICRIIGQDGENTVLKYQSGSLSDEDTLIDPYTFPDLQDGLGYGYLYRNGKLDMVDDGLGGLKAKVVLVANCLGASVVTQAVYFGEVVRVGDLYDVPGTGGNKAYSIAGF